MEVIDKISKSWKVGSSNWMRNKLHHRANNYSVLFCWTILKATNAYSSALHPIYHNIRLHLVAKRHCSKFVGLFFKINSSRVENVKMGNWIQLHTSWILSSFFFWVPTFLYRIFMYQDIFFQIVFSSFIYQRVTPFLQEFCFVLDF